MKKIALLSAVAMVGLATAANASVVQLTTDVAGIAAYNNSTDFVAQPFQLSPTATTGVVYEIPIYFQLSGLAAGQSFGNMSLDIHVNNDLTKLNGPGGTVGAVYFGNNTPTYPFGKGTQTYFDSNSDQGNATADGPGDKDGIGVVAYINAGTPSPQRAAMGIGSPYLLGWAYVNFPTGADQNSTVTITPTQFSYSQGGVLTVDNSAQLLGTSYTFVVPEPASIGLAGIGALGLLARRRRQA